MTGAAAGRGRACASERIRGKEQQKMNDYTKPVYQVDGREFRTIHGLQAYLLRKHSDACEISGVRQSDRTLRVYVQGSTGRIVVATYQITAPEIGKPMVLTRVPS
jgi:hypothetical protein